MNLRSLQYVHALAEMRSFVRAAEKLGITQSALTRGLQSIEKELGLKLFDRGRGGVFPTSAGVELARDAGEMLRRMRTIERNMGLLAKGQGGQIAFGMGPLPASVLLADLLAGSVNRNPGLHIRVQTGNAEQLLSALMADALEFIIVSRNLVDQDSSDFLFQPIGSVRLAALVREDHPLAGRKVTDADLAGQPLIGGWMSEARSAALQAAYQPTISCDDYHALRAVALTSDAVWISADLEAKDGLVTLDGPSIAQSYQIAAVSLRGRTVSPAARVLIKAIRMLLAKGRGVVE